MFNRFRKFVGLVAFGCCFQLVGCESNSVVEVIAEGIKTTAVDVSALFFDALVDRALELN